jgi:hypothetical protein
MEHMEPPLTVIDAPPLPHGPTTLQLPVTPAEWLLCVPLIDIFSTMGHVKPALHSIGAACKWDVAVVINLSAITETYFQILFIFVLF